jgi:hypothetical protein
MKMYTKSLLVGLLLLPLWSAAQDISTTLKYINQQFEMYNEYETSFDVDIAAKEIICEDRFGILKAKFSDVKFDYNGNNFGIYCLSDGKCIRYYGKDGSRKYDEDYNNYTMGLRLDEEIIPHIDAVISKFSELKAAVLSSSSGSSSGGTNAEIDSELRKINAIFQRSSEYKNTYYVDYTQNAIVSKTQNCKAIIPVKSGLRLTYYKRDGGDYSYGFYFENSDNSILESCTSFEDYTERTYEYVNNYSDAKAVVTSLNRIIDLLRNSSSSNFASGSSSNSSVDDKLRYINQQFAEYNAYNTVWKINYTTKQLIWTNDFGTNTVSFSDCEVRADYENGWIGVYCLNSSSDCIVQEMNSGGKDYYKQYTMSLNDDGEMISHMSTVINEFAAIKNMVLNGTSSKPSSTSGRTDEPDDSPDK